MIRLFKVFFPTSVIALLVSEAILIYACYLITVFGVIEAPDIFLTQDNGFARIGIAAACIIVGLYFSDLYSQFRVRSKVLLFQQISFVLGVAFLFQSLLDYMRLSDWALPKWMMIYSGVAVLILQPSWRIFYDRVILQNFGREKILMLGTSPAAQAVAGRLTEQPHFGMTVLGYVDTPSEEVADLAGGPLLGPMEKLAEIVAELKPDRILVGVKERRARLPMDVLLSLRFSGIHIEYAYVAFERVFGRVNIAELHPSELIFMSDLGPRRRSIFWQGVYSPAIALIGFVISFPVMILAAILVKLTSQGPVFYGQVRVGMDGSQFKLYKFRSMYKDAEGESGAVWATKDDPRVTPLGWWLRKLRIDELPQLLNVLRGDMSIVGPRPERPEFVQVLAEQIPYYRQRLAVRPGITGWAQINYKYGDTFEDTLLKLEYDLYYIKNLNFALDLYIMFQTVKVMLLLRGAQ